MLVGYDLFRELYRVWDGRKIISGVRNVRFNPYIVGKPAHPERSVEWDEEVDEGESESGNVDVDETDTTPNTTTDTTDTDTPTTHEQDTAQTHNDNDDDEVSQLECQQE